MTPDHTAPNPVCRRCEGRGIRWDKEQPCASCWSYTLQPCTDTLGRSELVELAAHAWLALEERQLCTGCHGIGKTKAGNVCRCHTDAAATLEQHRDAWDKLCSEYLWLCGYDPEEVGREGQAVAERALAEVRERVI